MRRRWYQFRGGADGRDSLIDLGQVLWLSREGATIHVEFAGHQGFMEVARETPHDAKVVYEEMFGELSELEEERADA